MYLIEVDDEAADQIAALPPDALPGLLALIDLLAIAPQAGEPYHAVKPDANMHTHTFGPGGHGMLVALIDDRARRVLILRVIWIG